MAEPISTTITATSLAGVSIITLLPGVDASTVLGAFAGASVFVMSSNELGAFKKLVFLILAFVTGVIAAPLASELLSTMLPGHVEASAGVGALIASALMIKVLIRLIAKADNPTELLSGLKGDKK